MKRRTFVIHSSALLAAAPFMNFGAGAPLARRVLVLGFDGMDPAVVDRLLGRGEMPAMRRLASRGVFTMMRSTIPPQSPVAWGSFISGADPGVYGIYDFLHRDPLTYTPVFAQSETTPGRWLVRLGDLQIPLKPGKVVLKREGRAFWDWLEERGVPATIVRVPTNYPPSASSQRTLAGMGTPDILGTYGIYTLYTTDEAEAQRELEATNVYYAYINERQALEDAELPGPVNELRREAETVRVPFKAYVDRSRRTARIDIQGHEILLAEKEYSGWVEIDFPLLPPLQSITGMVRFLLLDCNEQKFRLYISPIHISPRHPALPISTPASYSRELADRCGLFHTIGLPADTKALSNETFSVADFITQWGSVRDENERLYDYELNRFLASREGLLFFYFSSLDQGQHMFWALQDPGHPYYHPEEAKRHGSIVDDLYRRFDALLGRTLDRLPADVPLLVISDHGFGPFRRRVNINTWLAEQGYLKLSGGSAAREGSILDAADWGASRAYALGLNGFYLNRRGREAHGIVRENESRRLLEEIKGRLEALTDPQSGERVVSKAYISADHFSANTRDRAPDIVLGFRRGYRISDSSAIGTLEPQVLGDNRNWWSGDHCIDPAQVPATFASSFRINRQVPDIRDIAPTLLHLFGIAPPAQMNGKSLL